MLLEWHLVVFPQPPTSESIPRWRNWSEHQADLCLSCSMDHENGAFNNWATVVDCGDIPNTPFDKLKAIEQLTRGSKSILSRAPKSEEHSKAVRMLSIGGDHTISKSTNLPYVKPKNNHSTKNSLTSSPCSKTDLGARLGLALRCSSRHLEPRPA